MLEPGFILENRYEIVEVVGTGGMSTVYKAKDKRLKRNVALKVLKSEYSDDMNFVSKFRVEAQASAGITHPNIVSVYDVGEDAGKYYIVMELVEGITLKEYIGINGRLSMDQAIDFSIQIASGLEVAHENHIIHRDIKPQNIIVSKNGSLKVTDFGIAKAATSNTMSTLGMGSVHYISPEQARGGYSDERSDIYSLGITMYEMVTGKVPFEGETNVAIALKHINNDIVPPRELYPDIYSSLEKVIIKATQKKPERRYLTAAALIADLKRVKANPNIDIVVAGAGVSSAPTQKFSTQDLEEIKTATKSAPVLSGTETLVRQEETAKASKLSKLLDEEDDYDFDAEYEREQAEKRRRAEASGRSVKRVPDDYDDDDYYEERHSRDRHGRDRDYRDEGRDRYRDEDRYRDRDRDRYDYDDEDDEEVDPKLEKVVMIAGVAAAIIIAVIVFVVLGNIFGWFHFGKDKKTTENSEITTETTDTTEEVREEEVPDVVGVEQEAAVKLLKGSGFTNIKITQKASKDVPKDYVISQSIEPKTKAPIDKEIEIFISTGPDSKLVPDVKGKPEEEAAKILEDAGFDVTRAYPYDDEIEKGLAVSTEPSAGQEAAEGSKVKLNISNGKEVKTVQVPNLSGKTEQEAKTELQNVKLTPGTVSKEYSDSVEEGKVISQSVAAGTEVKEGTSVNIVISLGRKTVTYTANVSGDITVQSSYAEEVASKGSVKIDVYIVDNGNSKNIYSKEISGTMAGAINISGTSSGLTTNNGYVTFSIIADDGTDLTSYYSNSLSIKYSEE